MNPTVNPRTAALLRKRGGFPPPPPETPPPSPGMQPRLAPAQPVRARAFELSRPDLAGVQRVVVADVEMRFGSMVVLQVKWALAAIPALILLGVIGAALMAVWTVTIGQFLPGR